MSMRSAVILAMTAAAHLLATSELTAQATLTIGPGQQFADVQAAVDSAQPGDELLVEPGVYGNLALPRGLTLRARIPGTVELQTPLMHWITVPAGEQAHLIGVRLGTTAIQGDVACDECVFEAPNQALLCFNAILHLQDCCVKALAAPWSAATASALEATDSLVLASGCEILAATQNSGGPRAAIRLLGSSRLRCSHTRIVADLDAGTLPAPAVVQPGANSHASVWLADSEILAQPGVEACEPRPERSARSLVTGPGVQAILVPMAGARRTAPPRLGEAFAVEFQIASNGLLLVFASAGLGDAHVPTLVEPELLLEPTGLFSLGLAFAGVDGQVAMQWQLPSTGVPVGAALWIQGFDGSQLPIAAAPPVGGLLRR
ncbi:MAG: hypothetical protein AB8H80_11980 [Planctomycetota bacterium]